MSILLVDLLELKGSGNDRCYSVAAWPSMANGISVDFIDNIAPSVHILERRGVDCASAVEWAVKWFSSGLIWAKNTSSCGITNAVKPSISVDFQGRVVENEISRSLTIISMGGRSTRGNNCHLPAALPKVPMAPACYDQPKQAAQELHPSPYR